MHCLHRNEIAGVAQLVAHLIGSEEVTGSIPVASLMESAPFQGTYKDLRQRETVRLFGRFCHLTNI